MKRIIEFQVLEDKYLFKENSTDILEVSKSTRQLDVKSFYEAFFANGKDYLEIEFETPPQMNKDDELIYNAIHKLITDICTKLKTELPARIDPKENIKPYIMGDPSETK